MKKLLFSLGTLSVATFPMMTVACSNEEVKDANKAPEDNGTDNDGVGGSDSDGTDSGGSGSDGTDSGGSGADPDTEEGTVFHLDTLAGVTEIFNKFLSDDVVSLQSSSTFTDEIYTFKIGDVSITNTWTSSDINSVINASKDIEFTFGDMGINDASETMEEAFNNLPLITDWDSFVGDATDGWTNKYLYYGADEMNADPSNQSGAWGDHNIKGHPIYTNSLALIEEAFGELPANIDLYHVERGGDTAKNLYFKLIDRSTGEILDDSFKIDVKWGSTQEEIDNFDKGFFAKIKEDGAQKIGRARELFNIITTKNDYEGLRDVIVIGVGLSFSLLVGIIWTGVRPFLGPFGTWIGSSFVFRRLMEPAVELGEGRVIKYLDDKYLAAI